MNNCNTIYITSLTTTDTGVILIPNRQITQTNLTNAFKYNLIIACGLKATNSLPVFIQTSAGNVPVLDKFANPVYSNQLRTRYKYCVGYGNKNTNYTLGQFIVMNNLCSASGTSTTSVAAEGIESIAAIKTELKSK